jgi:predicted GNAT superfamily acetyltransferase
MRLRHLAEQSININAHRSGNMIWIDMMHVPTNKRGTGQDRLYYEQWEDALPADIVYIRLIPVDAGNGKADGFWEAMGFDYMYHDDVDEDIPPDMVKGINGNATPASIEYVPEDDEEY